jgi:pilus assembly protein Flp/PilA
VDQDMLEALTWFVYDEEGAAAIEYGLIGALASVAGLTALSLAGSSLDALLTEVANAMAPPSP